MLYRLVQNVRKASAQLEANKTKINADFAPDRKVRPESWRPVGLQEHAPKA